MAKELIFPNGIELFSKWQSGATGAKERMRELFDQAIDGVFDANFAIQPPQDRVNIAGSVNMLTLYLMNDLYGIESAEFYKVDAKRYVRTTMLTRRMLGMNKLYISWPNYAFSGEAIGQSTMYPDKYPPGSDPGDMLINRENWQSIALTDFSNGIPKILDDILNFYHELTGLDPILQLSAPYSLAADTFGQEPLLGSLIHDIDFANTLLDHLADNVITPWAEHFFAKFPNGWIEFSDASGSPFFIGPKNCKEVAIRSLRRIIDNNSDTWGDRIYDANYRGDYVAQVEKSKRQTRRRKSGSSSASEETVNLRNLMDAKHSICRDFVIRLFDDLVPVSFYEEEAISKKVPLFVGIGAGQIDRNSIKDVPAAEKQIKIDTIEFTRAIKSVASSIQNAGYTERRPPWPGTIYFEDINSESNFKLIEIVVEETLENGMLNQ